MYFEQGIRISDLVSISLLLIAIFSIVQNTRTRKAEFIRQMFQPAIFDEDFLKGFYLVAHNKFVFDEKLFPLSDTEMQIDRVLGHLSLLCHYYSQRLLSPPELDFYGFIIRALWQDEQIQKYLEYVRNKAARLTCATNPYQPYIDYCVKMKIPLSLADE